MKYNSLFILFIYIFCFSCTNRTKKTISETNSNSIKSNLVLDSINNDNYALNFSISDNKEELKVYENIYFGMSRKEYNKLYPKKKYTIGDNMFWFLPDFNQNGQLYAMTFNSIETHTGNANSVKANIYSLIDSKYKKFHLSGDILSAGAKWKIGKKHINLSSEPVNIEDAIKNNKLTYTGPGEFEPNYKQYVCLRISNVDMEDKYSNYNDLENKKKTNNIINKF